MWHVYILRCADKSLYTGITNNLSGRIDDHNNSKRGARYTKSRRPVILVYSERKKNKSYALKREAEIKSWTRAQKELFLRSFYANLHKKTKNVRGATKKTQKTIDKAKKIS